MNQSIHARLEAFADAEYRRFTQPLIPQGKPMLGVRLGPLRTLAREIAIREDWRSVLGDPREDRYHEHTLLRALTTAYAPMPEEERIALIEELLPRIDNWAVCDSFCATLKGARTHREIHWQLINRHLFDRLPYPVRFSLVMLNFHFTTEPFIDDILGVLPSVVHEDRCVRTAVAWTATTCFTIAPEKTLPWLQRMPLPPETLRMTVGKILDSRQIGQSDKAHVRTLRSTIPPRSAKPVVGPSER